MATPADLTNKALWLRAKGRAAGVLATWPDDSGEGNNAVSGSTPTVVAAATPNGGEAVQFNNDPTNLPGFTLGRLGAKASSTNGNFTAAHAVDGDTATRWVSSAAPTVGSPQWLRVQPRQATVATSYTITPLAGSLSDAPRDWVFQGSADGSSWTDLDTRAGVAWATSAAQTFNFTNATQFKYYRLLISATNNGTPPYVTLSEFQLNGLSNLTGGEMWVVIKEDTPATGNQRAWRFGTSDSAYYRLGGAIYESFGITTLHNVVPTLPTTSWRLYRVAVTEAGEWNVWLDNTLQMSQTGRTLTGYAFAALADDGSFSIAEVLVRNTVSTSQETADLISYFNTEHGLAVPGGSQPLPYDQEVLADAPLAYWRLGEASGTTMNDSSGNARHGSYVGSPALGVPGLLADDADTAMGTTANADMAGSVASAAWMNTSALTVEAVVKMTSAADGQNGDAVVSRYTSSGFDWLLWRNNAGYWAVQAKVGATTYNVASTTLAGTEKAHLVFTHDGTTLRLYVNGAQAGSVAAAGTILQDPSPIEVGRYSQSNVTVAGATFDEVAIYGTALSSTRLKAHYASSLSQHSYTQAVIKHEPFAYWRFGEASGAVASDSSGFGRSLALTGTYALGAAGLTQDGSAISFTSGKGTTATGMPTTVRTVMAIIKPSAASALIVERYVAGVPDDLQFQFYIDSAGKLTVWFTKSAGQVGTLLTAPTALTLGVRHHVALVFDGTTTRLFVGGTVVASVASGDIVGQGTCNKPFTVGSIAGGGSEFVGVVDEVALYGHSTPDATIASFASVMGPEPTTSLALTHLPANVAVAAPAPTIGLVSAYSQEVIADGPLAYWKLDETSGSLADSSGNNRDMVVGGSPTYSQPPLIGAGSSVRFGATYGWGAILGAPWMALGTSWSFEFWLKSTDADGARVIARDDGSGPSGAWWSIQVASGKVYFINNPTGANPVIVGSTTSSGVLDGNPHHIVVTHDGTNVRFYVDGALDNTVAYATGLYTPSATMDFTLAACASGAGGSAARFDGLLDEVAVYGAPLSGARVASHYNTGSGASTPLALTHNPTNVAVAAPTPTLSLVTVQPPLGFTPPVANVGVSALVPALVSFGMNLTHPAAGVAVSAPVPTMGTDITLAVPVASVVVEAPLPAVSITLPPPPPPRQRCHIHLPITDQDGDLLPYADVVFVDSATGAPTSVAVYGSRDVTAVPLASPATFNPGIIDVWTDDPATFDLLITGPNNFSAVYRSIDLSVPPQHAAKAVKAFRLTGPREVGMVAALGGWKFLNLVPAHFHDGSMAGSTVLDPSVHVADTKINQTWVGFNSDTSSADSTGGSSLGAASEARGVGSTALGSTALSSGARGVTVGSNAEAQGADSVVLGANTVEPTANGVSLAASTLAGAPSSVDSTGTRVGSLADVGTDLQVGSAIPLPATPAGVTQPLWLLGDGLVPGKMVQSGDTVLAGVGSLLALLGGPGAAKGIIESTEAGALGSLLAALEVYGLLDVVQPISLTAPPASVAVQAPVPTLAMV